MNLSILQRDIGGLPAWAWGLIVLGGGIGLWFFIRKQGGGSDRGSLGQNTQPPSDPTYGGQIDPYTGVPYSIESQINPATGQPNYYNPVPSPTPTPPPTPTPQPAGNTYTATGQETLSQIAQRYMVNGNRLTATDIRNANYGWLERILNALGLHSGYGNYTPPPGQVLNLPAGAQPYAPPGRNPTDPTGPGLPLPQPQQPSRATVSGAGGGPYQATPFWPVMTDVESAQRAVA